MSRAMPPLSEARIRELIYRVQRLGDREAALELQRASKRKAHRDTNLAARLAQVVQAEWKEQVELARQLDADQRFRGRWFHAANGEARDARTGAKLKKMGVRPGVPDVWILVPAIVKGVQKCGTVIELKRLLDGELTPEQRAWGEVVGACGFEFRDAYGWRSAWRQIEGIYRR